MIEFLAKNPKRTRQEMFFSGYSALVGEKGSRDQNAEETIDKLVDQVSTCTLLEDRRAAVQGLRGLARDWKLVRFTWSVQ
jgi:hypothetical protein